MTGGTVGLDVDRIVGQTRMAVSLGQATGQHGTEGPVVVVDVDLDLDRLAPLQGGFGQPDQFVVDGLVQTVILNATVVDACPFTGIRLGQDTAEIQPLCLPVVDRLAHIQTIALADHLVDRTETQLRHQLPNLFRHEEKVVHHMFRLAGEALAQFRILGGDPHRTGIQMAFAHHQTSLCNQGGRGETHFIGAQHGGDHHIASGTHASIDLHRDAVTQTVQDQGLMGLCQSDLPGRTGMFDGSQRGSTGTAVISGDRDMVGMGLGDPGRNRSHTHF